METNKLKYLKLWENYSEDETESIDEKGVLTIKIDGSYFGHVTKRGHMYITHGQLGEVNEIEDGEALFRYISLFLRCIVAVFD